MSIRAYKITKMELEKDSTYNITHDEFLNGYLNPEYNETIFEVSKDNVLTAMFNLDEAPEEKRKYYKKILQGLLDDMDKIGDEYLSFYVY